MAGRRTGPSLSKATVEFSCKVGYLGLGVLQLACLPESRCAMRWRNRLEGLCVRRRAVIGHFLYCELLCARCLGGAWAGDPRRGGCVERPRPLLGDPAFKAAVYLSSNARHDRPVLAGDQRLTTDHDRIEWLSLICLGLGLWRSAGS